MLKLIITRYDAYQWNRIHPIGNFQRHVTFTDQVSRDPKARQYVIECLDREFPEGYVLPKEFDHYFKRPRSEYLEAVERFAMTEHEARKKKN